MPVVYGVGGKVGGTVEWKRIEHKPMLQGSSSKYKTLNSNPSTQKEGRKV
jgi:hypothetical protein